MAGYILDGMSDAEDLGEFHIDTPDLINFIGEANRKRRVCIFQLDGDELVAALWGLTNFRKST